jgi:hypothetical protein
MTVVDLGGGGLLLLKLTQPAMARGSRRVSRVKRIIVPFEVRYWALGCPAMLGTPQRSPGIVAPPQLGGLASRW